MNRAAAEAVRFLQGEDEMARFVRERVRMDVNGMFWLKRDDALRLLELLEPFDAVILWGDVGRETADDIVCTYDNWHYEGSDPQKSLRRAREYIKSYLEDGVWFHIVWQDRIDRYKALRKEGCPSVQGK